MVLPLSPTAFVPCPFRPGPLGSPQGLFPCLDPTAGAHRLFLCLPQCSVPWPGLLPTPGPSGTAPSMAAPHTWPSCPVPCSGPWEGSLPGLPTRFPRLFMTGPYICSSRLGPQPDPRAGPQTVSAPWILTAGPYAWSPSLSPHLSPSLLPTWAASPGATGPPTLSQGHPRIQCPHAGGTTPIPAASPSHRGSGRLPQTPSLGQSLHSPRKSCPLPLHPFFSAPPVSNSFSSPVMRGLHGKLQQDAFVGRQSEWGRQFGALSATAPPDPCWGDI